MTKKAALAEFTNDAYPECSYLKCFSVVASEAAVVTKNK
jgi:hypothetical protein